jgi:hypothetical protein
VKRWGTPRSLSNEPSGLTIGSKRVISEMGLGLIADACVTAAEGRCEITVTYWKGGWHLWFETKDQSIAQPRSWGG